MTTVPCSMADAFFVREAADRDASGLITLISSVFSEYDGCVLDLAMTDRDLLAIRTYTGQRGGNMWVAEQDRQLIGCAGYTQSAPRIIELKRLYIAKTARKQGLGHRLYTLVLQAAQQKSATLLECWSDTRFKDAHSFYQNRGFAKSRKTRALNDPSNSIEFHFSKALEPS